MMSDSRLKPRLWKTTNCNKSVITAVYVEHDLAINFIKHVVNATDPVLFITMLRLHNTSAVQNNSSHVTIGQLVGTSDQFIRHSKIT